MRWPWQHVPANGVRERKRREREMESEDARVHLRALAEELTRSIDRLEKVVSRMEAESP